MLKYIYIFDLHNHAVTIYWIVIYNVKLHISKNNFVASVDIRRYSKYHFKI